MPSSAIAAPSVQISNLQAQTYQNPHVKYHYDAYGFTFLKLFGVPELSILRSRRSIWVCTDLPVISIGVVSNER